MIGEDNLLNHNIREKAENRTCKTMFQTSVVLNMVNISAILQSGKSNIHEKLCFSAVC